MTADSAPRLDSLEPAPLAARRSSARAVAADLEAIFGSAPAATDPARPTARRLQPATARADEPASGARLATVGTLASAAFLGLAAAAFVITRGPEPRRPERPRPPVPIEVAQRAPIPSPGPLDPLGGARVPPAATIMTTALAPAPARPLRPRAAIARAHSQGAADVSQADRRLRQAWASAVRAGVPRPVMVSYRDRWEGLRLSRAHQPRRLVAGYGALARDLDRAAARSHSGAAPRRYAQRSWRSRYAPWWS